MKGNQMHSCPTGHRRDAVVALFCVVVCGFHGMTMDLAVASSTSPVTLAVEFYRGACDASAAVALDANYFVVADDEDPDTNLRVYRFGQPDPIGITRLPARSGEADIEGAERIGDRLYWIGSHSRTPKAKLKVGRDGVFLTRLSHKNGRPVLTPSSVVYTRLLDDLVSNSRLAPLRLDSAASRAPESADGLNIEALGRSGSALLIGFRSPQVDGKAIVVPLNNPAAIFRRGERALLGDPSLLSLGGRGIRGMTTLPNSSDILIIAGPKDNRADFALYRWSGPGQDARPLPAIDFGTLHPEALLVRAPGAVYVVSDDGDEVVDGKRCGDLPFTPGNARKKRFRVAKLPL